MPSLIRPALWTHTTLYALSVVAIFCANPSAAEPANIALLRPHSISPIAPPTQISCADAHRRCESQRQSCMHETNDSRLCARRQAACLHNGGCPG
jgi:hypothetical protein